MNFKTDALNGKYQINGDVDHDIMIPGRFKGKLSDITDPAVLDGMIARKNNLVSQKPEPVSKAAVTKLV